MNDPSVVALIANALKYLSLSVSNIAIIMNPEKIYLHGQLFKMPEDFPDCQH